MPEKKLKEKNEIFFCILKVTEERSRVQGSPTLGKILRIHLVAELNSTVSESTIRLPARN